MENLIYDISYLVYSLDNSARLLQYVSLTNSSVPWGINTSYIYKNDVMLPQFNANNNDLVIENMTNNIILKTPSSMKTIIENGLSVDTLYIKSKNIRDLNKPVPYITNTNNAITVIGSFSISGDFNIQQNVNSTGSFSNSIIKSSSIIDTTITGGLISDISIINVTINNSNFIGGSIINTNFTGGSLNVASGTIRTCSIVNCNLTEGSITCPNINNSTLTGSSIVNCNLTEGSIICPNINNSTLTDCSIVNCNFRGASSSISCPNINNSVARDISITLFYLSSGTLTNANISRSTASDISITLFSLSGGRLTNANISRSTASDISISLFSLSGGTLTFANISRSTASDISINNYTLSGGTIIASNIGCNESGVLNVPKRGAFTNISVLSNINVNGTLDISQGTIRSRTITGDTISGATISGGTINATTISGSAILIRPNAVSGTRVININTGNVNTSNGIAINNVSVATTQHIINAIPPGLVMAYYYTGAPMPLPPNGWAICNGSSGTPDLRGRFILGFTGAPNPTRSLNSTGGAERVTLSVNELPSHTHGAFSYGFGYLNRGNFGSNEGVVNSTSQFPYNVYTGNNDSHENMPPYYVLYYIMKLNEYNFNY